MGQVLLLVEQTASTPLFFLHHSVTEFHGAGAVLTGYSNRIFPYVLSQPTELYESYDSRYRSDDYHISLLFHCPAPPFFQYTSTNCEFPYGIEIKVHYFQKLY